MKKKSTSKEVMDMMVHHPSLSPESYCSFTIKSLLLPPVERLAACGLQLSKLLDHCAQMIGCLTQSYTLPVSVRGAKGQGCKSPTSLPQFRTTPKGHLRFKSPCRIGYEA